MGWDLIFFFHQKKHKLGVEPKNRQNESINDDRAPPPHQMRHLLNFLTSLNAMLKNNTVLTLNATGTVYIPLNVSLSWDGSSVCGGTISWDGSSVCGGISCCCLIIAVNFFNFNIFSANWLKLCFCTSFTLWSCGSIVEYICWTLKSLSCSIKVFSISDILSSNNFFLSRLMCCCKFWNNKFNYNFVLAVILNWATTVQRSHYVELF